MKIDTILRLLAWLFWVILLYLVSSFINLDFNPQNWGTTTRICSSIVFIFISLCYLKD